jgi:hypothetical protein
MHEVLFNVSGMRLPVVMTVVNRAVSAPSTSGTIIRMQYLREIPAGYNCMQRICRKQLI